MAHGVHRCVLIRVPFVGGKARHEAPGVPACEHDDDVDVLGGPGTAVGDGGQATDDHVRDGGGVEDGHQAAQEGCGIVAHGSSKGSPTHAAANNTSP
jgi:hypothetical protein